MRRSHVIAAGLAMALAVAPALLNPATAGADQRGLPMSSGQQLDYVAQRALAQRGVSYVYGGGNTSGPTNGVRPSGNARPGTAGRPGVVPGLTAAPRTGTQPGLTQLPGGFGIPGSSPSPQPTTVGFDSSGLIQYAFAGVGIKMPRTSGEQCSVGRKVLPSQARRGDLICYGPGGSQSVALYLGNGQMIEATQPAVTVSAARTSNMAPYLTRIIDS